MGGCAELGVWNWKKLVSLLFKMWKAFFFLYRTRRLELEKVSQNAHSRLWLFKMFKASLVALPFGFFGAAWHRENTQDIQNTQ